MFKKANWWNEKINETEKNEIARILGLTGQYTLNGSRIYVDGAHPEYSTPECSSPLELIAYEKAGAILMSLAVEETAIRLNSKADLLKNNWDYHEASYSCHENYLISRQLFHKLVSEFSWKLWRYPSSTEQVIWIAHLLTRQIFTGSGRLNITEKWPKCFSLSQRSPFIKYLETLDTTYARAIVNTRNRPYADAAKFARLHVICGDSNIADWSNLIKYGASCLTLMMLEDVLKKKINIPEIERYIFTDKPEEIFSLVEKPEMKLETKKSKESVLGLQLMILMDVMRWLEYKKANGETIIPWAETVVAHWAYAIDAMTADQSKLDDKFDYRIKRKMFEEKIGTGRNLNQLRSLDYNYHIVNSQNSLFENLVSKNFAARIISEKAISKAIESPPDSRARLRSLLIKHFAENKKTYRTTWHHIFIEKGGRQEISEETIELPDPRNPYIFKASSKTEILIEQILAEAETSDSANNKNGKENK